MIIDSFVGEHRFLSNFYPSVIVVEGLAFSTVEHAYQAWKTYDRTMVDKIQGARTPGIAKRLGRQAKVRSDWEQIKDSVMLTCLRLKFELPAMRKLLLATGDATLIETNTWSDRYWGVCGGIGQNKLGVLLMQVREEYK
jgi:ribA/ribD-fused uncharacterized protein